LPTGTATNSYFPSSSVSAFKTICPVNCTRADGTKETFPSESLTTTFISTFPLGPCDCFPDAAETEKHAASKIAIANFPRLAVYPIFILTSLFNRYSLLTFALCACNSGNTSRDGAVFRYHCRGDLQYHFRSASAALWEHLRIKLESKKRQSEAQSEEVHLP